MFLDVLLPNLLIFAAGLTAAFGWLRTGFVRRGVLVMVAIWTLADWALITRFVFGEPAGSFPWALLLLQLVCIGEGAWFLMSRLRRRYGKLRPQRRALFGEALQHYLRDELGPAEALSRRLLRHDPWDVASTILLANVRAKQGLPGPSRRLLARARALDQRGEYRDLVHEQLRRLSVSA